MSFDPNAAAAPDSGLFGLPDRPDAEVQLVPVPYAATVSYGGGTERGPEAILAASRQVDLYDLQVGRPYQRGIRMLRADPAIASLAGPMRERARPVIEQGGAGPEDRAVVEELDRAGETVNASVYDAVRGILARGALPGVVGGDHSVPFGAIRAAAEAHPGLGILHVDAHADLRHAYEGFRWSHASIMDNVLREIPQVERLVQVGIRDFCEEELEAVRAAEGRVVTCFDMEWRRRQFHGTTWAQLCREALAALPALVYVSFDIDGLDPALCPHTGTPVPGGLSFAEACFLLQSLVDAGHAIVGFDLCEVAPGPHGGELDANVGARLLYKLCGFGLLTR